MITKQRYRRKAKKNRVYIGLIVALSLLIVGGGVAGVYFLGNLSGGLTETSPAPSPAETDYFYYGDQPVAVRPDVPVNAYTPDQFYTDEQGRVYFTGEGAVYGIDVSSHQGEIDWAAVAASGVDFAMIRVGYRGYSVGNIAEDNYFRANIQGALENGIDVGIYFYSQAISETEAKEEAAFVLDAISGYNISFPVVFDWEVVHEESSRSREVPSATVTACALAFCQEIQAAGYHPGVYFYQNLGYFTYDLSQISQYALWLAEYDAHPDFYYAFQMWQYSNTGTVDGIDAPVDLNISFVDYGRTIRNTANRPAAQ